MVWPTSYIENGSFKNKEDWKCAKPSPKHGVRMQWDPDHGPKGNPLERRAIQLGMAATVVRDFWNTKDCIENIEDITPYVSEMRGKMD